MTEKSPAATSQQNPSDGKYTRDPLAVVEPPDPWYLGGWKALKNPKVAPYLGVGLFLIIGIIFTVATLNPLQMTTRATAHQASITVLPAKLSLPPNGTLQVWATADSPVAFINVQITFNPAVVKLTTEPVLTTSTWGRIVKLSTMADTNTSGKLDMVIGLDPAHVQSPPNGTFQIATLQFEANTANSNVTTSVVASAISQLVAVDTTVFTVTAAGSTITVNPLPSPTPTTTQGVTPIHTRKPTPTTPPNDITPPVVTITSPTHGSVVPNKGSISIKVTASDASKIATITITMDGTIDKTCKNTASCQDKIAVNKIPAGSHTITATAMDKSTNHNTATTTIAVTK